MTLHRLRRWWPVAVYAGVSLAVLAFAFLPFNRTARRQSQRTAGLARELEKQIAVIESLPRRQADLDRLAADLGRFKSALAGTHEVDAVMSRLRQRAEAGRLELWTLNPSIPALIQLDAGGDSLARLDLAVLPVAFECRGVFDDVARFLQDEESRPDFFRWTSLAVSADPVAGSVQAKAEIRLFLLPPSPLEEAAL